MATSIDVTTESLAYHISLPARLPDVEDECLLEVGLELIQRLVESTEIFLNINDVPFRDEWTSLHRSLSSTKLANLGGGLSKHGVIKALKNLAARDFVLLNVAEQNAGIALSLQNSEEGENILFEISEASPQATNVLESMNALLWEFPSSAVTIPLSLLDENEFVEELAKFLAQASIESVKHFAAHTKKAGSLAYESRDTVDPVIITGLLTTLLKTQGKISHPQILRKRIRDDVCHSKNAHNPWRRSPMWLLLRVTVERHLRALMGSDVGHFYYKLLMCLFHSRFLHEYTESNGVDEEVLYHLAKKLVTRIDKLSHAALMKDSFHFKHMQDELHIYFEMTVDRAMAKIPNIPQIQKNDLNRLNKSFPNQARSDYFILAMKNSAAYIKYARDWNLEKNHIPTLNDLKNHIATSFAEPYFVIAEHESQIEAECLNSLQERSSTKELRTKFHMIADAISNYLKAAVNLYKGNPEQMSKMILLLLELWVQMDICVIQLYGLLKEYSPGIPHDLANVCLLPYLDDLERLHRVQEYLLHRQQDCDTQCTIFDQPSEHCFAVQYYNSLPTNSVMKNSLNKIQKDAQRIRDAKEREWTSESKEYNDFVAKESTMSHEYFEGYHDTKRCSKCYSGRVIRRWNMSSYEWPLPSDTVQLKTVLFELHCPREISIYRDISWTIMSDVASMSGERENFTSEFLLSSYRPLNDYATAQKSKIFSLASIKKAFSKTHYATVKFPARLTDVCLPNGADYRYYDLTHKSWPPQPRTLSFAAHCSLTFPSSSIYSSLNRYPEFAVDKPGPSSYSIVASRTRCPAGILMKEFLAMQALLSGYENRWPQILIELGSQNINLSNESAYFLMNLLILQVGPRDSDNVRGIVHRIFLDPSFCSRLVYWINWRLDEISSIVKRREVFCMEILISLALRLFEIGNSESKTEGFNLVQKAREIILKWLSQLQKDVEHAINSDSRVIFSHLVVWASLLCRRTFIVFRNSSSISPTLFNSYLRSTISLHENLCDNYNSLPDSLKKALVRDSKLVWSIRHVLRASFNKGEIMKVLSYYVSNFSLLPTDEKNSVTFLPAPQDWCISAKTNESAEYKQQIVVLNLLTGYLLFNGKPIGRLPKELKENDFYQRLFGREEIKVLPSNIHGMDYMSTGEINEHKLHFGFREGKFVIQAVTLQGTMEFLPHEIFLGNQSSDLPNYLIFDCAHWLNYRTNCIEIRKMTNPWKHKPENWKIDFSKRIASSDSPENPMTLIDPNSSQCSVISSVFKDFEMPSEILVYADGLNYIKIYLPRLELKFFINQNHRFECSELSSEIDPNQDIGTWYGLRSKLVLREISRVPLRQTKAPRAGRSPPKTLVPTYSRSILVPTGKLSYKKVGSHVEVRVANTGKYARFIVNQVLGRIDVTNPNDRYLKALFHAVTSCLHNDPLTGRTGTEEAIHYLKSALCQPVLPLSESEIEILTKIARITPLREFFPKDMKVLQVTSWDSELTTSIQHDGFRGIVEKILEKSWQLTKFFESPGVTFRFSDNRNDSLTTRNLVRRSLYSRGDSNINMLPPDTAYFGHDLRVHSVSMRNLCKCAKLIRDWPQSLPTTKNLTKILERWSSFQGFLNPQTEYLISDLINMKIPNYWGSLVNTMRSIQHNSKYKLMFILGIISFNEDIDMEVIATLIAYAVSDKLKSLDPPDFPFYERFERYEIPTIDTLMIQITSGEDLEEGSEDWLRGQRFAKNLLKQWPCEQPVIIQGMEIISWAEIDDIMDAIRPEWLRIYQNFQLSKYLSKVQTILDKIRSSSVQDYFEGDIAGELQQQSSQFARIEQTRLPVRLTDILCGDLFSEEMKDSSALAKNKDSNIIKPILSARIPGPTNLIDEALNDNTRASPGIIHLPEISALRDIIQKFLSSDSAIEEKYAKDLSLSLDAFEKSTCKPKLPSSGNLDWLPQDIERSKEAIQEEIDSIQVSCDNFMPVRSKWLKKVGLWPCMSRISLLESLRSTLICSFGPGVKKSIINFAVSLTRLQQLYRMHDALVKGNKHRLSEELNNPGHENWDPMSQSDWLLLELDGNILIRCDQVDVARETITPTSGMNSVLQMNMGQGKTSCIMPMAAITLANGNNLARVIVPRALLDQTLHLFQTRLSGLVGREVKHIPFSRKLSKIPDIAKHYLSQLENTQKSCGILVTLPEHLLSFKLSIYQALSDGLINEAKFSSSVQKWISEKARDVIDECDEILSLRTQLIYPMGTQKTIDGHPYRWEVIENLLKLVNLHASSLSDIDAQSLTVTRKVEGEFPLLCFIHVRAEELLITRLKNDICSGRSAIIPTYSSKIQEAIRELITHDEVSDFVTSTIDSLGTEHPINRQKIYLIRGLLVHKILITVLKKRWNVQYGLHPDRDPIAVPYHAKGCPSDQSEWGHPDVALLLTCLSFYYEGLNFEQFRQTLKYVRQTDDPVQLYDQLVQETQIPESYRNWININEQDEAQVNELWNYLRRSINTVNFFLNKFVFPRHAKQFTYKLQASGWDIPLYDFTNKTHGIKSNAPRTTGFSGTNDWKRLLPLTISQQDLPGLSHTNAEVITYLLQNRNSRFTCTADTDGKPPSELDLLQKITNLRIKILVDAGAQIMEMDNLSLVTKWLEIDQRAQAAFYFQKDNRPQILYRNGRKVNFYSSPYADNLKNCLVYLDQVHTRGTDLKLPSNAKAALTLGPNQTKDHTVQAAMRLRQLGSTQSVHFFAPSEVQQSILSVQGKTQNDRLTSFDVVSWLLKQTCIGIEFLLPLYSLQGYDFCRRAQAALTHSNLFGTDDSDRQKFFSVIRPEEELNLVDIYGTKKIRKPLKFSDLDPAIDSILKELKVQSEGYMETGHCHYSTALQEVEQEREVANEIQVIEQKQKPVHYTPLKFKGLHPHILEFIETGKVRSVSSGYELAFDFISRTYLGRKYGVKIKSISPKLFISIEFDRTVKEGSQIRTDHLHRPVHWILWSKVTEVALVLIPEEVEIILPMLRKKLYAVHLLTYAAPTTQKMLEFNDFDHYNVPPLPPSWRAPLWLRIETGILAKRLYFDYSEYDALVKFLGVKDEQGKIIENDHNEFPELSSTITPQTHDSPIGFTSKPLCFLQDWLALRGEGQEFIHTPMGYICQGRPILPQFSFCSRIKCTTTTTSIPTEDENQKQAILNFTNNTAQQDENDDLISFDPVQSIPGQENETGLCEDEEDVLDLFSDLNLQ